MDFFEAQARAKKRTSRLVVLFSLAVIGTVLASYVATVVALGAIDSNGRSRRHARYDDEYAAAPVSFWQPKLFFGVTAATLAVVGLASLVKWNEFSAGGSAVAESVGGRHVDPHTTDLGERRLLNVVEEMAIASGTPIPAVFVLDDEPGINAFAAGLTTSDAVVTVTRGALQKLNRDELQGVIGHEFSHILNGDMRLNLRITAIVFGILVLGLAGRGVLWSLRGARVRDSKNSGGIVIAILLIGLALLIVGYVGYFFGRLIQAAVSRQREFLADASAVQFTRNPPGITGALRKIGGFALGSSLETHKAGAIGHFFFAQAFGSSFGGLWATHPPLPERIAAIDPQWDGKMIDPPEVVDVARQSFVEAGLVKPKPAPAHPAPAAMAAIAAIGTLTPDTIANAQALLEATPARLREAARTSNEAPALICGLLLDNDPVIRAGQRASINAPWIMATIDAIEPALRQLRPEHYLPLVQLAIPSLRTLPAATLDPLLVTIDTLIKADGRVSPFEFALQKLLRRTLALAATPTTAVVQIYSFQAVVPEISVVLSALAHVSSNADLDAQTAFVIGAGQLKLVESQLTYLDANACDWPALDQALDKLATASLPIKQRLITAAAHVVGADGQILVTEAELLRAISAALDVPMPPLG